MSPEVKLMPLRKLRPNPRNARTHSKKQVQQIAESIRRFNWTYPVLADEHGTILAGHGRLAAAEFLGLREVPVLVKSGLSEPEKRALMLADNKIAANAGWNREVLATELGELAELLPECDLSVEITGFEPAEIDSLLADFSETQTDPADDIVLPEQHAVSRPGDLWLLGAHRLLCGDSKFPNAVLKLMGDERARLVFTDPPYNVRIRDVQGRGRVRHREFAEASGEMSPAQFTTFLTETLKLAAEYSTDGSIHFVCMDWRHMGELLIAGRNVYGELKNLIVWTKANPGQGTFYRSAHELIFAFKKGSAPHANNFELGQHGRYRTNVWSYGAGNFNADRLNELKLHPTVKPVAMVVDAIKDCSGRGDIVLDPFLGSGTTLVAAERVGRRGFGLEIDPLYTDVAIRRWQNFTKRDAVLADTKQTFDELAASVMSKPGRRRK
jgi:DNA modification methylase